MTAKETGKLSTRQAVKNKKQSSKEEEKLTETKLALKARVRLIPIWLRIIIVLFFILISTVFGVLVGYGVIGDGNMGDALKPSTWQHIIDLVEKESEQ